MYVDVITVHLNQDLVNIHQDARTAFGVPTKTLFWLASSVSDFLRCSKLFTNRDTNLARNPGFLNLHHSISVISSMWILPQVSRPSKPELEYTSEIPVFYKIWALCWNNSNKNCFCIIWNSRVWLEKPTIQSFHI